MQDHNIFGCKIYGESIFLGLNLTLHTHTPVHHYSKYPPGLWMDDTAKGGLTQF